MSESEEIISFQGKALRLTPLEDQARSTWLNRASGKEVGNFRPHSPWEGYHLDIYPSPGRGIRFPMNHIPRWATGLFGQWLDSVALQVIRQSPSDEQPGIKPPISGRQTPPLGLVLTPLLGFGHSISAMVACTTITLILDASIRMETPRKAAFPELIS